LESIVDALLHSTNAQWPDDMTQIPAIGVLSQPGTMNQELLHRQPWASFSNGKLESWVDGALVRAHQVELGFAAGPGRISA
jgi:hypothetical protein